MTEPSQALPPFNELSDAELERLAILAEECAEVIQIVGKILRHGYESTHPDNPEGPDNRQMLETELGHVFCLAGMMTAAGDVSMAEIKREGTLKRKKIAVYLHHQ